MRFIKAMFFKKRAFCQILSKLFKNFVIFADIDVSFKLDMRLIKAYVSLIDVREYKYTYVKIRLFAIKKRYDI